MYECITCKSIDCLSKSSIYKKIEPKTEGKAILINHKTKAANKICNTLDENIPIKNIENDPLIPSSANVFVGIKVVHKNIRLIETYASKILI